jgi:hypothetical protein
MNSSRLFNVILQIFFKLFVVISFIFALTSLLHYAYLFVFKDVTKPFDPDLCSIFPEDHTPVVLCNLILY